MPGIVIDWRRELDAGERMAEVRRVMVVDDSVTTATQMRRMIDAMDGYRVVGHARNGAEALKLHATLQPDIVCMDINMPVMDGLQAVRALVRRDSGVKVIMVSSLGGVAERAAEALRLGAREVLAKPFDSDQMLAAFNRLEDS